MNVVERFFPQTSIHKKSPLLYIDCRRNRLHRVWERGGGRVEHLERIVHDKSGEFF